MTSSRITELASTIASHTAIVEDFLSSEGLPTPSFDVGALPQLPLRGASAESRDIILDATQELQDLILGPIGMLRLTHVGASRQLE